MPLQVGYLFDHPGTVFFSVFMSFWAVTFLEYWKRTNATLAHHWDCMDFQEEEVQLGRHGTALPAFPERCGVHGEHAPGGAAAGTLLPSLPPPSSGAHPDPPLWVLVFAPSARPPPASRLARRHCLVPPTSLG